ncbi:MAG: electron transport complex subunit RsxC [Candidatus Omnitrophica bacterium]|nr:electron transport complex subunit RsxC [Candidatus Omnitrophota bacterium]
MLSNTFRGGVCLAEEKELTVGKKTKEIPAPKELIVPLCQHIGSPNESIVKEGDAVRVGQVLGDAKAFVSAPVHSPISGTVKSVQNFFHPVFGKSPAVLIENDEKHEPLSTSVKNDPARLSKEEIITIVRNAGIVGMGGAAFPTHVKLKVPEGKIIDTLIINGAECEPYLTGDHRLMIEKTKEVIDGVNIVSRVLGAKKVIIAVESNKLSAVFAMKKVIKPPLKIEVLKTKYPQGGEKQLIKAILKKEVPPGKLPLDVGVLVQNVGTCFAIQNAVCDGKPLTERCVTFTGSCLKEPGNYIVKVGTRLRDVIDYCGGFLTPPAKIISGGPMMGVSQYTLDVPVVKGTTGVLFLSEKEAAICEEMPCIKCAKCVDSCPLRLLPTDIMRMVKYSKWEYLKELHPSDCVECGACSYVCPSKIPLTQYIKLGKIKELNKR